MPHKYNTRRAQRQRAASFHEAEPLHPISEAEELPPIEYDIQPPEASSGSEEDATLAFEPKDSIIKCVKNFLIRLYNLEYLHLLLVNILLFATAIDHIKHKHYVAGASLLIPLPFLTSITLHTSIAHDQPAPQSILGLPYEWMLPLADIGGEDKETRISPAYMFPLYAGLWFTGLAVVLAVIPEPTYTTYDGVDFPDLRYPPYYIVAIRYLWITFVLLFHDTYLFKGVRSESYFTSADGVVRGAVGFGLAKCADHVGRQVGSDLRRYCLAAISAIAIVAIWKKIDSIWEGRDWILKLYQPTGFEQDSAQESLERRASEPTAPSQPIRRKRRAIASAPAHLPTQPNQQPIYPPGQWYTPPPHCPAHRQPHRFWNESLLNITPRLLRTLLHLLWNLLKLQLTAIILAVLSRIFCILVGTCHIQCPASFSAMWAWFKTAWMNMWTLDRMVFGREGAIGKPVYFWLDWVAGMCLFVVMHVLNGVSLALDWLSLRMEAEGLMQQAAASGAQNIRDEVMPVVRMPAKWWLGISD